MKYLHKKVIRIPIYRGVLVIILTNDIKKLQKYLPKFDKKEGIYAHTWLENYKGTEGYVIVFNFHNKLRSIYHGTITHEAIHTAHFILDNRGIQSSFDNDEPIAYLAEWITDEIYKFTRKHKLNPK